MSRLDQHIAAVQNKLALQRFLVGLAWSLSALGAVVTIDLLVLRLTTYQLPHVKIFFYAALGVAALAAMIFAIVTRPSRKAAAVAIDEKLKLHEKISTALFIRNSTDPFAIAAVRDAETTAEKVVLNSRQHFPLQVPRASYGTLGMACAAALAFFLPQFDLFGHQQAIKHQEEIQVAQAQAKTNVKEALATVEAVPKSMQDDQAIRNAKIDLEKLLNQPIKDPQAANRSAIKALQDAKEAMKKEAENNARFAQTQEAMKDLSQNLTPGADETGPVADAQRKIAEGKYSDAADKLEQLAQKFDQMDQKQQQQAAQQMQQLAKQLQQAAGNPQKQQQQIAKQLQQQLGMNQQQAQQMAQQMQQAAQGNQQAQQQIQQQVQQMMKQMNNGQGPTAQQQQQIQQAVQQMQAQANGSATAGRMSQSAQQMAQAMQQAASGQNSAGNQQAMGQGAAGMQQQLQNLDATAKDAQAVAAAQQQIQNAVDQAGNNNGNGQGQQQGGQVKGRQNGANPWQAGNPNGQGAGMGNAGVGAGGKGGVAQAPGGFKPEVSPTEDNGKGRILASNFIKDNNPIVGKSTETLKDVAESAQREASEEVDSERVSPQAESAVKKYFQSMEDGQ